jgi:hypothetical protein
MTLNVGILARLSALTFAVSLVSCSAAPAGGGYGDGTGGGGSGSSSSGGNGGGSGSGQNSTGSGGSSGSGPGASGSSSGSSSGSGSGASSGSGGSGGGASGSSSGGSSDAGSAIPTHGCGQATSCTPASDLAPPAAADGFQIATPDMGLPIQGGQEAYYCFYKTIPGNAAIKVGSFQSFMTKGASHHFILYTGSGADGTVSGGALVGGVGGCVPSGVWVYATSTSGQIIELKMPDGVGLPMPANQTLIFNVHVINTGSGVLYPKVKLNVLYAKNATQTAGAVVSFNSGITVPAGGSQDVKGYCSNLPAGSKFFAFTTHVHRHGGSVADGAYTDVNFVSGGKTTNIVHSTDWENPDVALWGPPNFLTVSPSDQFTYDCHYVNKDPTAVTFGETAANGEMCMSIGYYFPVGVPTTGVSNPTYCH